MTNLSGKRELSDVLYDNDIENGPGVYILFRTINGPERYVGRSDTDLKTRLVYHKTNGEYKYYRFKNCTLTEAYEWECKYWHKYQSTIDNSSSNGGVHPASPNGKAWICPICGR